MSYSAIPQRHSNIPDLDYVRATTRATADKYHALRRAGEIEVTVEPGDWWSKKEMAAFRRGRCHRRGHNFTTKNPGYNELGWYHCKACEDKPSRQRESFTQKVLAKIQERSHA